MFSHISFVNTNDQSGNQHKIRLLEKDASHKQHNHSSNLMILFEETFYPSSSIMEDEEPSVVDTTFNSFASAVQGPMTQQMEGGTVKKSSSSPGLLEMTAREKEKRKKDFPWKLHKMLADVERDGMTEIISWDDEGKAFKVHQPEVFVKEIMPKYFNQTLFRSFQRMVRSKNSQPTSTLQLFSDKTVICS